jgi:hypothetical protein
MNAKPYDLTVITKTARRTQSAVAAGLGALAILLWQSTYPWHRQRSL